MHAVQVMATTQPPESSSEPTRAEIHETTKRERHRSHVPEDAIVQEIVGFEPPGLAVQPAAP